MESDERSNDGLPRSLEIVLAFAIILVSVPVLAAVMIAVRLSSRGPVLFRHERVGRGGERFKMLKFRTMYEGSKGPEVTAKEDRRITPIGRVLRKTKLDELPELWNVVRGDMALVGPRPEATVYVDLSSPLWQDVLRVRPGVTDPTTLRLRNEEELLAGVGAGEHETFYKSILLPFKLRSYQQYLITRTWRTDVAVLGRTVVGVVFPDKLPPPGLGEIVSGSMAPDARKSRSRGQQ